MRRNLQLKAWLLLLLFLSEIFSPMHIMALGSGPSQPEMAAFTPAGTTEMVDPFTGDFSYNIPLMDVEGYPINIAYNSDVSMQQEASWVGLGWNLNVGSVNRSVRGLPDDFKGEKIESETYIKPMIITKFGAGAGVELFGLPIKSKFLKNRIGGGISHDVAFIHNNYKGFGLSYASSFGPTFGNGLQVNPRIGGDLNSLDGSTINSSLGVSISGTDKDNNRSGFSIGGSAGSGYNTRTGQKMLSLGGTAGYFLKSSTPTSHRGGYVSKTNINQSLSGNATFLPVGMITYTPYPQLKMKSSTHSFSASVGWEVEIDPVTSTSAFPSAKVYGSRTEQSIDEAAEEDKAAYGYLYTENAGKEDLKDFNRERQIALNSEISNLSPVNFTYDVFSVSAQGVSGTFRPFRNDIGTLNDPQIEDMDPPVSTISGGAEYGLGKLFHGGSNITTIKNQYSFGPLSVGGHTAFTFKGEEANSNYEKVYFKAAGELTEVDDEHYKSIKENKAIAFQLHGKNVLSTLRESEGSIGNALTLSNNRKRKARTQLFSTFTAAELTDLAATEDFGNRLRSKIYSNKGRFYKGSSTPENDLTTEVIERMDAGATPNRKGHHISAIVQSSGNGERYVYGIPAYNFSKEEITFATQDEPNAYNRVAFRSKADNEDPNDTEIEETDRYHSTLKTPAYAHSFLLTEKQSSDYQDLSGDGVSPDDIGNAWKFNYTRTADNFHWRVPYADCNFQRGFETKKNDQKASLSKGTKEMWYTHSIESKNQVAEFIISPRRDAVAASNGVDGGLPNIFLDAQGNEIPYNYRSYRLDKIVLYDKIDRILNKEEAVPIKTVEFFYDYSLCEGVENFKDFTINNQPDVSGESGKLSLQKIEISYGNSNQGKLSPYTFEYKERIDPNDSNSPAYNYNTLAQDRWGNYKPTSLNPQNSQNNNYQLTNEQYPYAVQGAAANDWTAAWNLTQIVTPSGGKITVDYEADDYAYVQNKKAMQMYSVIGVGDDEVASNNTQLYDNTNNNNNNYRLYIDRPSSLSEDLTQTELKKAFFGNANQLNNMYFRFKVRVVPDDIYGNDDMFEYVSGYVNAIDIDYCKYSNGDPNKDVLYIEVENIGPHPISRTAWGYLRENLFDVVYKQPNPNNTGVESIIRGIAANLADIRRMFGKNGVERDLERREVAREFRPFESFIRLNTAIGEKKGGGSRVSKVQLSDQWNKMVGNEGTSISYGQQYDYTTTDELGNEISSGVASYEPMIGGDENPFRLPVPYQSQKRSGHIPAIDAFQETPFGESFFSSPQVGYSKIIVSSINKGKSKSANAMTEYNYYTAKDFPAVVDETQIEKFDNPSKKPTVGFPYKKQVNTSEFTASQGYAISLNDMHGKLKSEETYTEEAYVLENPAGNQSTKRIISGKEYNYHHVETLQGKVLNNEVQVLTDEGIIENKLLGVEYDLAIDSRRSYESSKTITRMINLDIYLTKAGIPIPIPMVIVSSVKDENESRTVVVTKTIQSYGIIESVRTYTDQYETTVYNRLFNGKTGQVLMTESIDEHQKNQFEFKVPAYLTAGLQRMGPAYENDQFEGTIQRETKGDCPYDFGATYTSYRNPGYLKHGDEIMIDGQQAWVDLDFEMPSGVSQNGKDPYITKLPKCYKWDIYLHFDQSISDNHAWNSTMYENYSLPNLQGLVQSASMYLPNQEMVDFLLNPTAGSEATILENFNKEFGVNPASGQVSAGANYPSILNNSNASPHKGFTDLTAFKVNTLFDMTKAVPIQIASINDNANNFDEVFSISDEEVQANQNLYNLLHFDYSIQTTAYPRIPFIIKVEHQDPLLAGNSNLSLLTTYFIGSYRFNDTYNGHLAGKVYSFNNPSNDLIKSDENASPCESTFRVLAEDPFENTSTAELEPVYLDFADDTPYKVIRSGNKNRLDVFEGSIVSSTNPLLTIPIDNPLNTGEETSKFQGLKTDAEILQVFGQKYSDSYEMSAGDFKNKILAKSDGKFNLHETYRYVNERKQNTSGVEVPHDGYLEATNVPTLWEPIEDECYFMMTSPLQSADNSWILGDKVSRYNRAGVGVEAQNSLGIYSSVITDQNGRVEAVSANSKQHFLATENFELHSPRLVKDHFSMLYSSTSSSTSDNFIGVSYLTSAENLNTQSEAILVEGDAHSGNYSIYLKGDNSGASYPYNINYNNDLLTSLVSRELGTQSVPPSGTHTLATAVDYDNEKTANSLALTISPTEKTEAEGSNGTNELVVPIFPSSIIDNQAGDMFDDFKPMEDAIYHFSAWVKEALPTEKPYHGLSPSILIKEAGPSGMQVSNFQQGKPINGWYQISGTFTVPSAQFELVLNGGIWGALFDDIRMHPIDANLKTFVYDQSNGRLKATLDENNYATYHEYDYQGIPSQIKRETQSGILTISESRQSQFNAQ